ncbi:HlyD family type I secretion periplasmic adaptor subunit [Vibrio comitans]|uniref:Membrane fusion protein (MFP) family protein n=1 Tax=Vibrio comitans NBRC 102076 TaxID=1219078 RepID=A0A4Y3IT11_9VIBR|nr:HlyD family type I secretion periplasmic adaptor subunit [Vibrio comitans]GEA61938.1 HlyD family type I secretion periplasmic adaptor subunit [Vibrio comitans NBRC 102076]
MDNNDLDYHIRKALVSRNKPVSERVENNIVLTSSMTMFQKVLLLTFVSLLAIIAVASQAEIDIVVSARGELLLDSDIEKVQHLEGGILEDILVKPGDFVFEGQEIARLKAEERNTQLNSINNEISQLKLDIIRYQALIDMKEPDYSQYTNLSTLVDSNINTWEEEYKKNLSNESLIRHDMEHKGVLIRSMRDRKKSASAQLKLIQEQLKIKSTLYKEEMASYVDVLNMRVQESNMVREIENLDESIMNERYQLNKMSKQLTDLIADRNSKYQSQIIEANKELELKEIQTSQHTDKVDRLIVYSPVDGVIDKVHFNFKSAVIPPGESIADIAPINNTLHGEAKIPRKELGFVEVGQTVKVKIDTYNFAKYGYIEGKITSVSRNSYEEEENKFYIAKIALANNNLERSGVIYNLSPFMEFTADIKTGSRKVIDYAAKPVLSAIEDAFDER